MRCYHCGQVIPDGAERCPSCNANQGAGATVVLEHAYNPYAEGTMNVRTSELTDVLDKPYYAAAQMAGSGNGGCAPAIQFPTNRSLWKMIIFGLLTFGIYDIVVWCKLVTELNVVACRYDGKRTMPYFAMCSVMGLTFGIAYFVWGHKLSNRIGAEIDRRGYDYKFSATTFWLWNVLGSLILVGPLVYVHKLMKAMNCINEDFNTNG